MTALLTTRDALVEVIADAICGEKPSYSPDQACTAHRIQAERAADALIASGAVVDAATLALPLASAVSRRLLDVGHPPETSGTVAALIQREVRALAAALTERSAR
jgi:hypothetical protein